MKVLSIQIFALSILASATSALAPTTAQAQGRNFDSRSARATQRAQRIDSQRAGETATRLQADTAICMLDQDTGAGTSILMVPSFVSLTLVKGMPARFGLVGAEICGDLRDNDCNGLVDENCAPEDGIPGTCGDGVVQGSEQCDDGNDIDGDACNNECRIQEPASPLCGDGIVQSGEECDDGNGVDEDECSNECRSADGPGPRPEYWQAGFECEDCMESECTEQAQACLEDPGCAVSRDCVTQERCMNRRIGILSCVCGSLSVAECVNATSFPGACAEELTADLDTTDIRRLINDLERPTTSAGRARSAFTCMARKCRSQCSLLFEAPKAPVCGDGRLDADEECDDGNTADRDGCSASCKLEDPVCGNGILEGDEKCDDGNTEDGDGCGSDCQLGFIFCDFGASKERCDQCMAQKCDEPTKLCESTPGCASSASCPIREGCMSRKLGPLSCLCGENTSVAACTDIRLENLKGKCAAEMIEGLGVKSTEDAIRRFLNVGTPTGVANSVLVCMARNCPESCSPDLLP